MQPWGHGEHGHSERRWGFGGFRGGDWGNGEDEGDDAAAMASAWQYGDWEGDGDSDSGSNNEQDGDDDDHEEVSLLSPLRARFGGYSLTLCH